MIILAERRFCLVTSFRSRIGGKLGGCSGIFRIPVEMPILKKSEEMHWRGGQDKE